MTTAKLRAKAKAKAPAGLPILTVEQLEADLVRCQTERFSYAAMVGPEVAKRLLGNNPDNRNINRHSVTAIARNMSDGVWEDNGESVIIARTGEMNDGQHRAASIVQSGTVQPLQLVFGVERATRVTVDQGIKRTAGHYLHMLGIPSPIQTASVASWLIGMEKSDGTSTRWRFVTANDILDRVMDDQEDLGDAVRFAGRCKPYCVGLLSPTTIGALYYLFDKIAPYDAELYMTQVCIGENIHRGDPAFAVRRLLDNTDVSATNELRAEAVIRGWNHFRKGKKVHAIRPTGELPKIT